MKMLGRTSRSRMRAAAFHASACLAFISCLAMIGEARISGRARFVYFYNCAGQILKLNIRTRRAIYLREFSRMEGVPQNVVDGCLCSSLRFDASRGLLYGVFPKEERLTEDGARHYRIIAVQLPNLKSAGVIEIEPPLESPPALLVSNDGRKLFVSYLIPAGEDQPARSVGVITTYDTGSLKVIESFRQPATKDQGQDAGGPVYFSEDAYLGEDGRTIYDRDRIITIADQTATVRSLDRDRILDDSQSSQLRSLEIRNPDTGKPYLAVKYADSAAGRALLFGGSAPEAGDVFFTVGLNDYRASAIIKGPLATSSTLHLTPDARRIVVEEIERQSDNRRTSRTGRALVYDVASGKEIREFRNAQLSDPGSRLLSITPDGSTIFFAVADGLLVADLASGLAENPKAAFQVDQWTRAVFADR